MREIILTNVDIARFLSFVAPHDDGCWYWVGATTTNGGGFAYGNFSLKGIGYGAHRISYRAFRGKLKPLKQIDHLCRNTLCVNPKHLEQVSPKTNTLRGNGPTAVNSRKTHCIAGHPLSGKNLIRRKPNWRGCYKCFSRDWKKSLAKRKARLVAIEEIKK